MNVFRKYYGAAFVVAVIALLGGFAIGYWETGKAGGAFSIALTVAILAVLEISLSFDNAVVNAKVLGNWPTVWVHRFLTWGMPVAVFGMRFFFPIAIVSVATSISLLDITKMAFTSPKLYAVHLASVHHEVAGFGGAFLFMVAFGFFFAEKHVYWLEAIETRLTRLGQIEGIAAALTVIILLLVSRLFSDNLHGTQFLVAGLWGIVLFIIAHGVGSIVGSDDDDSESAIGSTVVKASIAGFLYLELLDSVYSFDGVIGAFVLTDYLPIIAIGLGVGAMFVRSMTIHLVEAKTLTEFRYLEHGAFYAILALAVLMFGSGIGYDLPEWITGLIGAAFIAVAFLNSLSYNRRNA